MPNSDGQILSRWSTRVIGANCTPLQFYDLVHDAILETGIQGITFSEITRRESGILSANRIYIRVRYGRLYFDVSAFLSGSILSVGYWLHADPPGVTDLFSEIPGIGWLFETAVRPATYFRVDQIESVQHIIHDSILGVISGLSNQIDFELPETDERPIWDELQP